MAKRDNTPPDQNTGATRKTSITKEINVSNKGQTTRYRVATSSTDPATGQTRFNFRTQSIRPRSK
jgi:hypothetical protein